MGDKELGCLPRCLQRHLLQAASSLCQTSCPHSDRSHPFVLAAADGSSIFVFARAITSLAFSRATETSASVAWTSSRSYRIALVSAGWTAAEATQSIRSTGAAGPRLLQLPTFSSSSILVLCSTAQPQAVRISTPTARSISSDSKPWPTSSASAVPLLSPGSCSKPKCFDRWSRG